MFLGRAESLAWRARKASSTWPGKTAHAARIDRVGRCAVLEPASHSCSETSFALRPPPRLLRWPCWCARKGCATGIFVPARREVGNIRNKPIEHAQRVRGGKTESGQEASTSGRRWKRISRRLILDIKVPESNHQVKAASRNPPVLCW
jgi:hypothetical protein